MKIAVIGAGLGGLSFGACAARDGHEVILIDKNAEPGGVMALAREGGASVIPAQTPSCRSPAVMPIADAASFAARSASSHISGVFITAGIRSSHTISRRHSYASAVCRRIVSTLVIALSRASSERERMVPRISTSSATRLTGLPPQTMLMDKTVGVSGFMLRLTTVWRD